MITEATYTPDEIRALGLPECNFLPVPVTVLQGQNLAKGTVIGRITASGKYKAYNDANADGSEVASGVLLEPVDASSTGTNADTPSKMYLAGAFVESKLVGLDANGKNDLNGRSVPGRDLFIF